MKKIFAILLSALALGGCENDGIPYVSLGLDDLYKVARMQTVDLKPAFTGESYRWTVKTASGADSLLSEEKDYIFLMQYPGTYDVTFQIFDPVNPIVHRMTFYVVEEEVEYSPYISTVYEYCPAPGQFVNAMPEYREGDTAETMRQKAEEAIAGKMQSGVSLGAYGGYITFGFDHTVVNVPGEYDIRIDGKPLPQEGKELANLRAEVGMVFQSFNLFANDYTNRMIGDFEIPAVWVQSINALFIILLAPVFSWAWPKLASMNIRPSSITKFVIGILCAAAGFGVMMLAAQDVLANGGAGVSPFWLVGSILMLTLGELCLSPIGLATMTLLAPERMRGQMMGLWFCASALGNLAAGLIGGHVKADQLDMLPDLFARCSIALLICAAVLIVLIVPIRRMLENTQTKPATSA